jgi:predicted RNase H-like HicB family nuclease
LTEALKLASIAMASQSWFPERETQMTVELEQEEDGRWIAEVPQLPGALAYGQTRQDALRQAQALALRILADRLDHGESVP